MKSMIWYDDLFKWGKKYLTFVGLDELHLPTSKKNTIFKLLQNWHVFMGSILMVYSSFGLLINIFMSIKNGTSTNNPILDVAENAPLCILGFVVIGKTIRLRTMRPKVRKVFEEFDKLWSNLDQNDEETVQIVNKTMRPTIKFCQMYIMTWVGTAMIFSCFTFCQILYNFTKNGYIDYLLPYQIWFPFDPTKSFILWLALTLNFIHSGFFSGITISLHDSLFALMVTCIVVHLKLLCRSLLNLPKEDNSNLSVKHKLLIAVDLHNKLARICKLVDEIFGPVILLNLLGSLLVICVQLFAITICEFHEAVKYIALTLSVLVEIFIFTAFGHTIVEQSLAVSKAIYDSPWTDLDGPDALCVKKAIVLIQARGNRYMKISAYGFTDMSLETFKKIIRTSFHYFALLRAVFQK